MAARRITSETPAGRKSARQRRKNRSYRALEKKKPENDLKRFF